MYADIKALLKTPRKKVLIAIMWKNNKFNTRGGDTHTEIIECLHNGYPSTLLTIRSGVRRLKSSIMGIT